MLPQPGDVERLVQAVAAAPRGLVVAGWGADVDAAAVERFAVAAGWPVLADAVSGLRCGPLAISTYDALLRHPPFADGHRPDLVVRLGAAPTGRATVTWLSGAVRQVLVDPHRAWLDPGRSACERIVADPTALLDAVADRLTGRQAPTDWLAGWLATEAAARAAVDGLIDSWEAPFEGRIARDVVGCLPDGATLVVGSSMPVRDLESFARPCRGVRMVANRGASGIDGFTSTVLGAASVSHGPVAALAGDLTFLHDVGGLLGSTRRGIDATLVVVDNDGGGIFSFLPQAGVDGVSGVAGVSEHFERLFATPHGTDLVEVATAFGVPARRVSRADQVVGAVGESLAAGGVRVVIVGTDRADNVSRHAEVWAAVAAAADRLG